MLRLNTILVHKGFKKTMNYNAKDMWEKFPTAVIRHNKNKPRYVEIIVSNNVTSYVIDDPELRKALDKL